MARTREDFREYLFDYFLPRWHKHGQEQSGAFLYFLNHDWTPTYSGWLSMWVWSE